MWRWAQSIASVPEQHGAMCLGGGDDETIMREDKGSSVSESVPGVSESQAVPGEVGVINLQRMWNTGR